MAHARGRRLRRRWIPVILATAVLVGPVPALAQVGDPSTLTVSIPDLTPPAGSDVPITVTLHIGDDVGSGTPPFSVIVEVTVGAAGLMYLTPMTGNGYPDEVCAIDELNLYPTWTNCTISFSPGDPDRVFNLELHIPADMPEGFQFEIFGNTYSTQLLPTVQQSIYPVISAAEPVVENSIMTTVTPTPTSGDEPLDVDWAITLSNDGDEDLTNPLLEYFTGMNTPNVLGPPDSGDTGADGLLGVGETWMWTLETVEVADTTMTVTGTATAPSTEVITYPADPDARAQATVTVNPTPPPVPDIDVPDDVTVEAADDDGAVVTYDATAGDDVETLACEPPSGSLFPVGTTEVTCTATDFYGNIGVEVFNVTVEAPAGATTTTTTEPATTTTAATTTTVAAVVASAAETLPATGVDGDQTGVVFTGVLVLFGGIVLVAIAGLLSGRREE
jgi:hypothetical protein